MNIRPIPPATASIRLPLAQAVQSPDITALSGQLAEAEHREKVGVQLPPIQPWIDPNKVTVSGKVVRGWTA